MPDLILFSKCVKKLQKGASLISAVDREIYKFPKIHQLT